ncbi:MAG: 16S rRNA (cytidine(1402)-2'-O)-methyltransferase [Methylococcaceae bacterium]|nr:16S rRNA (cytidine(1402)-2'-O)-methyltransferase [Methylococcaceae bacterium]
MKCETPSASGVLYLVATPIGNLGDLGFRAVEVLKAVALIACEDTRHSRPLLDHYGIDRPLVALHEHNENKMSARLIERLLAGESVGLVSDAGTPLINDPGYPLVRQAREAGIRISPIPGPCALIAALSASGLPGHRFAFEGFPPRKSAARRTFFKALLAETRTQIFYEASHRVEETLRDAALVFPATRRLVIGRELTKRYETLVSTTVGEAPGLLAADPEMRLGEFVLLIEGATDRLETEALTPEQARILGLLLRDHSVKSAVNLTVEITGARRDAVYREALRLSSGGPEAGEPESAY